MPLPEGPEEARRGEASLEQINFETPHSELAAKSS